MHVPRVGVEPELVVRHDCGARANCGVRDGCGARAGCGVVHAWDQGCMVLRVGLVVDGDRTGCA